MKGFGKFGWVAAAWRWLAAGALGLALVGAQAASAAGSSSATIMVLAPGAPQGAVVNVEWFNALTNAWVPVSGWTGTLNQTTGSGTPFQTFAVLPENYGQSSFRWVVFNPAAAGAASNNMSATGQSAAMGSVWGVSSPFALPNTDGVTLQTTLFPAQLLLQINQVVGANSTSSSTTTTTGGNTTTNGNTTTAGNTNNTTTTPARPAGSILITSLSCPNGCNASAITAKFAGLPASSWITVEWLDGNGIWQPVMGWQGPADFTDASGKLVKQFGVYQANYGQGPFRWAVYNAPNGGSLVAVSPSFNLPSADGQNEILNLAS